MLLNLKNRIFFLFLFLVLFCPVPIKAKIPEFNTVSINMNPEFPRAYENISIDIKSYSIDLNQLKINWYKNNILEKSGIGIKTFSFKTGKIGTSDAISIQIISSKLGEIIKTINVIPAEVDLIWEADSITPPFYKGKAMKSSLAKIKIVAIPSMVDKNGKNISSKNLIYKWKKDWKVLGSKSGYGKNILIIEGVDNIKNKSIKVEVETVDGRLRANSRILTKNYQPKIVLYEKNPLLGIIYENAISNDLKLKEKEVSLVAVPFFFSKNNRIKYNWFMNDKRINNQTNNLILRQEEGGGGSSNIRLDVQNLDSIMQSARNKFNVIFGEL